MSQTYGTGLIPDDPKIVHAENVVRHVTQLVGLRVGSLPVAIDHRHLIDKILNQGRTRSCVGAALATAIYLRGRKLGGVTRPSAKGIYDVARLIDNPGAPLVDDGCRPLAAMIGIQEHGLGAESRWKLPEPGATDAPDINEPPPFDLFHAGADALLTGYYRADAGNIIINLKQALAQGHFPVFGMHVPETFSDVRGSSIFGTPLRPAETNLPGHLQAACGYDDESLHAVSSWGYDHGDAGIVRVSWGFIASDWCFARMVITSVPYTIR